MRSRRGLRGAGALRRQLEVFVRTKRIGRTSITTSTAPPCRDDLLMCNRRQTRVLVGFPSGAPRRSRRVRRAIAEFEGADLEQRCRPRERRLEAYRGGLEAVDRIVNRESAADEVLRRP